MPSWKGSTLLCCCTQGTRTPDCQGRLETSQQKLSHEENSWLALATIYLFGLNVESTTGRFKWFLLHHSYVWPRLNVVQTKSAPETYLPDLRQASLSPQAAYSILGKDKQHSSRGGKDRTCALDEKTNAGASALQYPYSLDHFLNHRFPENTLFPSSL